MGTLVSTLITIATIVLAGLGLFLPHQPYPIYVSILLWYLLITQSFYLFIVSWLGTIMGVLLSKKGGKK